MLHDLGAIIFAAISTGLISPFFLELVRESQKRPMGKAKRSGRIFIAR